MTDKPASRIGFIGTGIMGGHMARRLAEAGFAVTAWNRSAAKAQALGSSGVGVVASAAEAARLTDVVICMLSSGPVCDEVLFGPDAVVDAMSPGTTLVVMSSIPVETAQAQGIWAQDKAIHYVDAPVSGGEKGAQDGTLAIMAGGEEGAIEALSPVFAPLGRVTHIGPVGTGSLTKLANQLIVASNICAVAEALLLAERGGASPAKVREALLGGFADSTVFRQHGRRMIDGDFAPGGPAKYQIKDTGTALALAASLGLRLPIATEVDRIFRGLVDHGGGDLDHSAAIVELRRMNRLKADA
ncbi:NAD(P)-dependent oxidoreductase [Mesorhizobium sp. DCY119]|uniref:NAD(P)-dependent oxidoreductase n=1 Tax=Mesorhizobium sp. DCY119 TaxID=2108445 RepID=UPI000E6BAC6D|nr:NAD(P)-dependent oxidoreductase [Mesorhizobium sp. DCY119]RJG46139.1 NAD(P)-dependent oxidoreductase [Mesorhizobium sp. DCY119]